MQIRARAWHKKQKKMYYPEELAKDQLTLMPDGRGFVNVHGSDTRLSQIYDYMVPLLSTGLSDKNVREIFEGDVIGIKGVKRDWSIIGLVAFEFGTFYLKWVDEKIRRIRNEERTDTMPANLYGSGSPWEVIGDIYENPELLAEDGHENRTA